MSWLRSGDDAYTDRRVLDLQDHDDWAMGLAAWGFLTHLAGLCAKDGTYDVAPAYIRTVGGPIVAELLKRVEAAGLMTSTGRGKARRWRIVDDAPEVLHIRTREEKDWEAQQRADNGNLQLTIPVLLRDGDACRYCRRVCQPNDNRSTAGRGRTFDHRRPGEQVLTPDGMVVACRMCNGARGQAWRAGSTLAELDERFPLLPPPSRLVFVQSTALKLEDEGYVIPAGAQVLAKAAHASRADSAGDPARQPATQAGAVAGPTTPTSGQHPGTQPGVATPDRGTGRAHTGPAPEVAPPPPAGDQHAGTQPAVAAPHQHDRPTPDRSVTDRSGTAGPGRVGNGSGRVPDPAPPPPTSPAPAPLVKRTRRGRRRRTPPPGPAMPTTEESR